MIDRFTGLIQENSQEAALLQQLDNGRIPVHLAIIMDGNGRWANRQGLKREDGHRQGAKTAKQVVEYAVRLGIKYLTLFTFSSENWKRPLKEINLLMNMLYDKLVEERELLIQNDIRFKVVGDVQGLPAKLRRKIMETEGLTREHKKTQLNLALNYGGRLEIIAAVKRIVADKIPAGRIDEKLFQSYLYTASCPDPDLLIRTSGELRISNFLLFQAAYAELYFTPVPWPEFDLKELLTAILEFQHRQRRFGKI
jgi:undecaprenyl diphosphate synthase